MARCYLGALGPQGIIVAHQSWNGRQFAAKEVKLGSTGFQSLRILRLGNGVGKFLLGVCDFFSQLPSMSFGEELGGLSLSHIVDEHLDFTGVGFRRKQFRTEIVWSKGFATGTGAECEKRKQHYDEADRC